MIHHEGLDSRNISKDGPAMRRLHHPLKDVCSVSLSARVQRGEDSPTNCSQESQGDVLDRYALLLCLG